MSAAANEYGNCYLGMHARFIDVQPVQVQGVAAATSRSGHEYIAVTFGRPPFYLEDREAFESFRAAFQRAERLADRVLGRSRTPSPKKSRPRRTGSPKPEGSPPAPRNPLPPSKSAARSSCATKA